MVSCLQIYLERKKCEILTHVDRHFWMPYKSFLLTHSPSTWKMWSFSRFWSRLQEKQFKSIRILLAESEAAVHEGLIIFLRTFINNQLSKGVWVKRNDLYILPIPINPSFHALQVKPCCIVYQASERSIHNKIPWWLID